jgi:hypothetical protein
MTLHETLTLWRELLAVTRRRDALAARLSQEPDDRLEAAYQLLCEELQPQPPAAGAPPTAAKDAHWN